MAIQPHKDPKIVTEEFFFSGSTEFEPVTVIASNIKEAHDKWLKVRKPTGNPQAAKLEGNSHVE